MNWDMTPLTVRSGPDGHGWARLGVAGPGLAWKPRDAVALFSERNGHVRWWTVWRWRVRMLAAEASE